MIVRSAATFTSDLPDDEIENEEGTEFIQYGGKSVAEAIGDILKRLGCVVDPPIYAHEHGWELDAKYGKQPLWGQITFLVDYVFFFEDPTFAFFRKRHRPDYLDMLNRLAQELGRDPRFHNVLWFRNEDVLSGVPGANEPISAE